MSKKYSQEFLLELNTLDGDRMGVKLAKACVNADLPITEVAKKFRPPLLFRPLALFF